MKDEEVHELLYQALETELGGVQVYQTAVRCAVNEDLKQEWEEYLEQTQHHVRIVEHVFARLELDPEIVAAECVVLAETKDHLNC